MLASSPRGAPLLVSLYADVWLFMLTCGRITFTFHTGSCITSAIDMSPLSPRASSAPSINAVASEVMSLMHAHSHGGQGDSHNHADSGNEEDDDGHHHHHEHLEKHLHGSVIAAVALLVALCIHSILAGVEIGIEKTRKEVMAVFIALIAHKCFAGYVDSNMQHRPRTCKLRTTNAACSTAVPFALLRS